MKTSTPCATRLSRRRHPPMEQPAAMPFLFRNGHGAPLQAPTADSLTTAAQLLADERPDDGMTPSVTGADWPLVTLVRVHSLTLAGAGGRADTTPLGPASPQPVCCTAQVTPEGLQPHLVDPAIIPQSRDEEGTPQRSPQPPQLGAARTGRHTLPSAPALVAQVGRAVAQVEACRRPESRDIEVCSTEMRAHRARRRQRNELPETVGLRGVPETKAKAATQRVSSSAGEGHRLLRPRW